MQGATIADDEVYLEVVGPPPRVGHVVEGAVVLPGEPGGDLYLLSLSCHGFEDDLLYEVRTVATAVPWANGSRLQFRFEIPLAAPPTCTPFVLARKVRTWSIGYWKKGAWFGGSSVPFEVLPRDEAGAARFAQLPKQVQRAIDSGRAKIPAGQEQYYEEQQLRMGRFIDAHGWKVMAGGFFGGVLLLFLVFILFKP